MSTVEVTHATTVLNLLNQGKPIGQHLVDTITVRKSNPSTFSFRPILPSSRSLDHSPFAFFLKLL